jgi:hypothetical protein
LADGWIKLHRELIEKAIWGESTPEQKVVLITLLSLANHQEKEWEWKGGKYTVKPGQFITSLESIANKSGKGVSIQNVRTALKRFEKYEFLTSQSTNRNRLITIVNWETYQSKEIESNKQTNKLLTSNQQATNKQLTTNKNDKNDKNDKNIYTTDFEEFYKSYPNPKDKRRSFNNFKKALKKHSLEEINRAASNYAKTVKGTDKQYIKTSANFLGRDNYYEDYINGEFKEQQVKSKNGFINYEQRTYDFDNLEEKILQKNIEEHRRINCEGKGN